MSKLTFAAWLLAISLLASAQLCAQSTFVFGKATLPANGAGTALTQADFNGDGVADFVWANSTTNTVSIIFSKPNGAYAPKVDVQAAATTSLAVSFVTGDFNGDGKLDLAVANNDGFVSFLYGNGDGTFQSRTTQAIPPVGTADNLAVGDFNGDGHTDLVVTSTLGTYVYLNDAKGNFTVDAGAPNGTLSYNAAVADFNNDGFADVMIGDLAGNGVMWLGDGKGGFRVAPNSPGAVPGTIADFNGDGILDDVYSVKSCGRYSCHYYLYEYFGVGDGTFTRQTISLPVYGQARAADFNHDGKMDLLLVPGGILYGNGDGTFSGVAAIPQGNSTQEIIGDFNNDGQLDIAGLDKGGFLTIALGDQGRFAFPTAASVATTTTPSHALFGDFNNDGKMDQMTVDGSIQVQLGNGDGTFQTPISSPIANSGIGGTVLGDFNKDGNLDLIVLTNQTSITEFYFYAGNGNGTFQPGVAIPASNRWPLSAVAGDFNGDGNLDVAVSVQNGGTGVDVFLGNGNGTFAPAKNYAACFAGFTGGTVAHDFNGDGILDIAVVCDDFQGGMNVLLGNGDGSFKSAAVYHAGGDYDASIALGDFNGDGKIDAATSGFAGVTTYLGNGDGSFQAGIVTGSICVASELVATDFNLDGKTDLACAYDGNNTAQMGLLLSNGDGSFLTTFLPMPWGSDPGPTAVDLNGDGALDLISSVPAATSLNIYYLPSVPVAFLAPSQLNFGYQLVGASSAPLHLSLSNPGAAPLTISSVGANGDFAVSNDGCSPTLAIAATCAIDITFTPSTTGVRSGNLLLGSNSVGGAAVLPLTGIGESNGAGISVSPSSLTFGATPVGTTSQPQTVTVTSTGASSVTFTSIVATGDFIQTNNCPQTLLGGGASCTLTISFQPTASGTRTGSVVLTDTAGTQTVTLSGTATAPVVTLNPASLTFATQMIKTSSQPQIISLTNSGTADLTISGITITGANASDYAQTNDCGTSVPINGSCSITVVFTPLGINTRTASVSIADNASGTPQTVALSGIGTEVKLTPAALKFPKVLVNSSSTKHVTFSNAGTTAVHISGIGFTGANPGDFSQTNTCGSSVAPKGKCSIAVTFTPTAKGARSATMAVTDDGGGSPQNVAITGTGK